MKRKTDLPWGGNEWEWEDFWTGLKYKLVLAGLLIVFLVVKLS